MIHERVDADNRMIPDAGQTFGPYEILGELGGGGMGIVLRAWDSRLLRQVAIKMLHTEYEIAGMRERFLLEARAASALNHPNICTIFDIGEQDGEPYLVMELLEGQTLKERIAQGALPVDELVCVAEEIAEALACAHAKGIVHRDIKPANIFLIQKANGKQQAKVLDFGLAKISAAMRFGSMSRILDLTSAGSTVGTLAYMSPEQARGENLDARSDLFALGVVMYEMATRRVPFRGATPAMVSASLLGEAPEPIRSWNDAIPKDLDRIIQRLLSKDRSSRFQNAGEVGEALARLSVQSGAGWLKKVQRAPVPLVPAPDPVARGKRRLNEESRPDMPIEAPALRAEANGSLIRPLRIAIKESGPRESAYNPDRPAKAASAPLLPVAEPNAADQDIALAPTVRPNTPETVENHASALPEDTSAPPRPPSPPVLLPSAPLLQVVPDATVLAPRKSAPSAPRVPAHPGVLSIVKPPSSIRMAAVKSPSEPPVEAQHETIDPDAVETSRRSRTWRWTLLVAVAAVSIAFAMLLRSARFGGSVLPSGSTILLTSVENLTENPLLDDSVSQALEIDLEQSPWLKLLPQSAFRAAVRQVQAEDGTVAKEVLARRAAQAVGARAYLFGEIRNQAGQYILNLDLLDTESNDRLASVSETAASASEIPSAIDRATAAVRKKTGESAGSIAKEAGLLHNGSVNLAALNAYARGERLRSDGQAQEAVHAFVEASRDDPAFALPQQRMAWILAAQHAEVEAQAAATRARNLGASAGDRVKRITEYTGDLLGDGDQARGIAAIRSYLSAYPESSDGSLGLARAMLLERHYPEALLAAEKALGQDATDRESYEAAQTALLGLSRAEDDRTLVARAQKKGVELPLRAPAFAYLAGSEKIAPSSLPEKTTATWVDFAALEDRAAFFDAVGQWSEGAEAWRQGAKQAEADPAFASAGASLLAHAALNRALAGKCPDASNLILAIGSLPHGPAAALHLSLVSALCGPGPSLTTTGRHARLDASDQDSQKSASTLLLAATQLAQGQPALATATLSRLPSTRDESPLLVYFRALSHLADQQRALAHTEFQSLLDRRGACFLSGTIVYPLSQQAVSSSEAVAGKAPLVPRF